MSSPPLPPELVEKIIKNALFQSQYAYQRRRIVKYTSLVSPDLLVHLARIEKLIIDLDIIEQFFSE
ncbi:hypothetical protein VNI00_011477 [Paramarasmius palmivorus]|uniref:Uncharacterized protein n=1 Tax=Paramarasmius palmivorus TaxID=297713 RepID=A0AAW0CC47_9AGAR